MCLSNKDVLNLDDRARKYFYLEKKRGGGEGEEEDTRIGAS